MKVILFSGKAESGKTSAAEILKKLLQAKGKKCIKIAYGDYVKQTAKMIHNWDGVKDEKGRELLQWWGTNYVREKYPTFWVDTVLRLAPLLEEFYDYLLIDDCRFPNEIECWYNYETVKVRIERPYYENHLTQDQRKHPSETSLDIYRYDAILIARDLSTLESKVEKVLLPIV